MNRKAQVGFVSYGFYFMLGLTIFLLGLYLAPGLFESSNNARSASNETANQIGLDCSNSSISTVNKVTCYAVDLSAFYVIGFLIVLGLSILAGRAIFT